jgi:integrase
MFGTLHDFLNDHRQTTRYATETDLVFPDAFGRPVVPNTWLTSHFYSARKAAAITPICFHSLRHYACSQLIAQGANILQIARVAGHADPSITLRVYSHLMADGLAEAAALYDPLRPAAVDAL